MGWVNWNWESNKHHAYQLVEGKDREIIRMRVPISILSLSLIFSVGLGSEKIFGAQLLTDDDLDQVTAAGTFRAEITPRSLAGLRQPGELRLPRRNPLTSAQAAINAAEAAVGAAQVIQGAPGLTVASGAVTAADFAVGNAFAAGGVDALNASQRSLDVAGSVLKGVSKDKLTPEIIRAAEQIQFASAAVEQVGSGVGKTPLNAAAAAIRSARELIDAIDGVEGSDPKLGKVIQAASDSISVAKEAITIASRAHQPPERDVPQETAVFGDPNSSQNLTDAPIVKFEFETGTTTGSGEAMPINSAPQPALNFNSTDGNQGSPFTGSVFQVQNMILNINICSKCQAGRDLVQSNNGYTFPIYLR